MFLHSLPNALAKIANKIGLQRKIIFEFPLADGVTEEIEFYIVQNGSYHGHQHTKKAAKDGIVHISHSPQQIDWNTCSVVAVGSSW
jgi:hypothetical protein